MQNDLSYELQAYEIDDLWKDENIRDVDRERVLSIARRIPDDARSVVDVGCGNGIFVNHLSAVQGRFDRLCGVDRSATALAYVRTEKRTASVANLPFGDKEFDLAACLEVIEHLPVGVYEAALKEVCRVARKYVIVSVPNDECLSAMQTACPKCHARFSPDYHMRSFVPHTVDSLFVSHGFIIKESFFMGETLDHYFGLRWYGKLQALRPSAFSWYAICPLCGYHGDLTLAKKPAAPDAGFKACLRRAWPKKFKPRWIGGLFERVGISDSNDGPGVSAKP